jgi:hypothetical protein
MPVGGETTDDPVVADIRNFYKSDCRRATTVSSGSVCRNESRSARAGLPITPGVALRHG